MARDRFYVSPEYKIVIDELKKDDVLGIGIVDNKDIFMLAVALGFNNPVELKKKDGLSLYSALKSADKALMGSVLMGTAVSDEDIDTYANLDASVELCEQYAEYGYKVLQEKYNDADHSEENLEKRLIKDLELLYTNNVENDI